MRKTRSLPAVGAATLAWSGLVGRHGSMKNLTLVLPLLAALGCIFIGSAGADVIDVDFAIDSMTHDGTTGTLGSLTSITVGSTTYSELKGPSSLTDVGKNGYAWLDSMPSSLSDAVSFDLTKGAFDPRFKAQFEGGLEDDTRIFVIVNAATLTNRSLVYPIDSSGNRLGSVSGQIGVNTNAPTHPWLDSQFRTYNHSVGAGGTVSRQLAGYLFTLADLGIDGLAGTTGIEIDPTSIPTGYGMDPQAIGIVVPEPSSAALLFAALFGAFAAFPPRRRAVR